MSTVSAATTTEDVHRLTVDEYDALGSLRLSDSEPQPDIFITDVDHPRDRHPLSAHLVIEVAVSSSRRDLATKPEVYAENVTEYWAVNLPKRQVVVHLDPGPDGYRDITVHGPNDAVAPQALGLEPMPFADLFAAA